MQQNVYDGRLYYPPEDPSKPYERDVMHPETNINKVIVPGTGMYMGEYMGLPVILSEQIPDRPGAFIWAQITGTRNG